jgi:hypothetical protein
VDANYFYLDRYRTKYHRNLRLGPRFSEGFRLDAFGLAVSAANSESWVGQIKQPKIIIIIIRCNPSGIFVPKTPLSKITE